MGQIAMSKTCPFCQINTEHNRVVRSSKLSTVFLSNPRLIEGHTLVIPSRHVEDPRQLSNEELLDIFANITFVENKLLASPLADGCDIRQHFRPFIPQGNIKIDHVHFHVLPRKFEDALHQASTKFELDLFKSLSDEEGERLQELFKN